jgi:hypothetical protein
MADEGIVDNYTSTGWDVLRQLFIDNGLPELATIITDSIQNNGVDNTSLVYEDLRNSDAYKIRFKGNFDRKANGKNFLSERAYIEQENMYAEVMTPYGAGALATRDNYAKFIANDVSVSELSDRFTLAYDRVTKAVNAEDKALVDELKKMYPGVTDNELATSLLLGKEGSKYLNTKINIAEIKAAETESGVQSILGADFLESQKINRTQARIGLSKVAEQKTGYQQASQMFGDTSTEDFQKELEQENLLGVTSQRTKRLASQARAQFGGQSGVKTGSLGKKAQV